MNDWQREWPAPAKINLFLHVVGRRADGYHLLQTAFQFIDWCDTLDFALRDDGQVRRRGGDGLPDDDLSVRAARLLQDATGCGLGVDLVLHKSIPAQAGLGGGSSDAATVLLALNRLWGLGLRRAELSALALRLGADVPVFVFGRSAFASGIGEELEAIELPTWPLLVAWPGRGLSTAAVFGSPALTRDTPPVKISDFAEHVARSGGAAEALGFGRNDLQAVAFDLLPELARLEHWLGCTTGSGLVRMSGSGSALFSPCASGVAFEAPAHWLVRECRALAQHPLLHWVDD